MCGITARVGPSPEEYTALVERCAERVRHRGPDGRGLRCTDTAVLAHRRLSIIDIEGGAQPLFNEDGRVGLSCNGEIYNYRELRARLEARHRFATRSDSEVILHLYEEKGVECVRELDGMFAFCLVDGARVLAARDPLGIKPLYLGRDASGGTWFASEIKALVDVCVELQEVPPGWLYTHDGGLRPWFTPSWSAQPAPTGGGETRTIRTLLERAVGKRLMSDTPVGVFLSGGLDSSVIAALVRREIDELHSFAVGLEGSEDLAAARVVSRHLGTRHHEYVYTAQEALAALDGVIFHLESYDPALLRSAIPCYFVSRLAAEHVKVVLTGEGADEAFAGYLYFREAASAQALHEESARLLAGLHNMNLQRVDRMTMAHGLEGRVPFLDTDLLDDVMAIDPRRKLHGPRRPEKHLLRTACEGLLPPEILWRAKREFAQGAGSEWTLRDCCECLVSDSELETAAERFPEDTPESKEAFHYRHIFERIYPGGRARSTVARWRGAFAPPDEEAVKHA
jgi:asparagine synthase (glutamine-hydrolysing)